MRVVKLLLLHCFYVAFVSNVTFTQAITFFFMPAAAPAPRRKPCLFTHRKMCGSLSARFK